jgi:membrane protease YdiL (CAAX protease family)
MDPTRVKTPTLIAATSMVVLIEWMSLVWGPALPLHHLAVTGVGRMIQIASMLLIVYWGENGLAPVGIHARKTAQGVFRGLIWSAAFAGCAALLAAIFYLVTRNNPLVLVQTRLPDESSAVLLLFITGGLLGPLTEEVFFRGLLYGYFRRWGFWPALLVSTLLFVLPHSTRNIPLTQVIGGILFAVAYEKERNLWAPVTIHISGNLAIFSVSVIVF